MGCPLLVGTDKSPKMGILVLVPAAVPGYPESRRVLEGKRTCPSDIFSRPLPGLCARSARL